MPRIGLMRHFPVAMDLPRGWPRAVDLARWRDAYDVAAVRVGEASTGGIAWPACLASDLPRARTTAEAVHPGPIEYSALLREPRFETFGTGRLRLPLAGWQLLLRAAWAIGHPSQRASRDAFRAAIRTIADRLVAAPSDILVVSHAGVMSALSAELRRRGFRGPRFRRARHALTYVFER